MVSTAARSDQVAVAFFGDGATNIGAFHEALNLASVWRLPVLFICENNLYMEYTPISAVTAAATRPPTGHRRTGCPGRSSTATTSSSSGTPCRRPPIGPGAETAPR